MMQPVSIVASGMVTPVGSNAASSCAAIRCALDNFSETRFIGEDGDWLMGAQVSFAQPLRGLSRLVRMVAPAIQECLAHTRDSSPKQIPLLLCVAEKERPGRFAGLDDELVGQIQSELGITFHPRSGVIARGRTAGAAALQVGRTLLYDEQLPMCLIAGVDSYLVGPTLAAYQQQGRLLTAENPNGFIPGEAAGAVLVARSPQAARDLVCMGIGAAHEKVTIASEEPLRAEGLVGALRAAFTDAQLGYEAIDYRIADANGEQYWFKEAALAMTRTLRGSLRQ